MQQDLLNGKKKTVLLQPGTWLQLTTQSSLCGNLMHGWRVILHVHTAMNRKSKKRKEAAGDHGFMVCRGS